MNDDTKLIQPDIIPNFKLLEAVKTTSKTIHGFADYIGMNVDILSQIINCRRNANAKEQKQIIDGLHLAGVVSHKLINSIEF